MPDGSPIVADFWFDPVCPWAWITSRWMHEVEQVRPVQVRWHIMCLSILNADKEKTERYQKLMHQSLASGRVVTAAARYASRLNLDPHSVEGSLYTELGRRFHVEDRPFDTALFREALEAAELPAELAEAATSTDLDTELRTSHESGMERVGMKVGTPIISVPGNSFFGPVVTPAPKGEKAGRLWDGVLLVSETDGFFELKRTRTRKPQFD
jgi:hypothetical protein